MALAFTDDDTRLNARTNAETAYREGASLATVLMMITPDDLKSTTIRTHFCENGHSFTYENDEPVDPRCPICSTKFRTGFTKQISADWLKNLRRDLRRAKELLFDG